MARNVRLIRILLQPLAVAVVLGLVIRCAVELYSIPSASMAPALLPGDQILVTRYLRSTPARGEIVVFRSPLAPDEILVKRVVALPGELVESHLGRIRISGHTLPEPYVLHQGTSGSMQPHQLADSHYFLLGDNREDSVDSRNWGAVPQSMIVGRVEMVLWSRPAASGGDAHAFGRHGAPMPVAQGVRLFKWMR